MCYYRLRLVVYTICRMRKIKKGQLNKVKRTVRFVNKFVPHLKKYHRDRLTHKFGEMVIQTHLS